MKGSFSFGKVSGIKISVHWTFLILIAWIVISDLRQGRNFNEITWSILFILSVFVCIVLHELGHAITAKRYKINTKEIVLLPIGGMANLEKLPKIPKQELIIAIVGPVVSLAIAAVLFLVLKITKGFPSMDELASIRAINSHNFLFVLMFTNTTLAVFNLLPAFPMDGGRVLRALLSFKYTRDTATRIAALIGQFMAVVFAFIGIMYNPFLILIGLFIYFGAQAESQYVQADSILKKYTVKDVLMNKFSSLKVNDKISDAVDGLLDGQAKDFLIMDDGKVAGTLSRNEIIKALAERGPNMAISEAMSKEVSFLAPDVPLDKVYFTFMQRRNPPLMPVMSDNRLLGVLDSENILEFIMVQDAAKNKKSVAEV